MEKTFTLDWSNLEDVSRVFRASKCRYFELKRIATGTPSRKERQRLLFDACQTIWHTDISAVYPAASGPADYYVYAHLDPTKRIVVGCNGVRTFAATIGFSCWPFYIGKGTGDRWIDFNRSETHRKSRQRMLSLGKQPLAVKVASGLHEVEALQCESKLIDIFGLITSGGLLCNLDEGLQPIQRRNLYSAAYRALCRLNQATHVNGMADSGKTRVVPDTSTMCS